MAKQNLIYTPLVNKEIKEEVNKINLKNLLEIIFRENPEEYVFNIEKDGEKYELAFNFYFDDDDGKEICSVYYTYPEGVRVRKQYNFEEIYNSLIKDFNIKK